MKVFCLCTSTSHQKCRSLCAQRFSEVQAPPCYPPHRALNTVLLECPLLPTILHILTSSHDSSSDASLCPVIHFHVCLPICQLELLRYKMVTASLLAAAGSRSFVLGLLVPSIPWQTVHGSPLLFPSNPLFKLTSVGERSFQFPCVKFCNHTSMSLRQTQNSPCLPPRPQLPLSSVSRLHAVLTSPTWGPITSTVLCLDCHLNPTCVAATRHPSHSGCRLHTGHLWDQCHAVQPSLPRLPQCHQSTFLFQSLSLPKAITTVSHTHLLSIVSQ